MNRKELLIQEAARYITRSRPQRLNEMKGKRATGGPNYTVKSWFGDGSTDFSGQGFKTDVVVHDHKKGTQHHYLVGNHVYVDQNAGAWDDPDEIEAEEGFSRSEQIKEIKGPAYNDFLKDLVEKDKVPSRHAVLIADHAKALRLQPFNLKGQPGIRDLDNETVPKENLTTHNLEDHDDGAYSLHVATDHN